MRSHRPVHRLRPGLQVSFRGPNVHDWCTDRYADNMQLIKCRFLCHHLLSTNSTVSTADGSMNRQIWRNFGYILMTKSSQLDHRTAPRRQTCSSRRTNSVGALGRTPIVNVNWPWVIKALIVSIDWA